MPLLGIRDKQNLHSAPPNTTTWLCKGEFFVFLSSKIKIKLKNSFFSATKQRITKDLIYLRSQLRSDSHKPIRNEVRVQHQKVRVSKWRNSENFNVFESRSEKDIYFLRISFSYNLILKSKLWKKSTRIGGECHLNDIVSLVVIHTR